MKEVFVVHGNDYYYGYGDYQYIYGIFEDYKTAEEVQKKIIDKLYEENKNREFTIVESIKDIDVKILAIPLNEEIDKYLGGYAE